MATYKAVMRPTLEYVSSMWLPLASSTSIIKLQVMQNVALRTVTGCTQDTNICLTKHTLPIQDHLHVHASQFNQKTQHPLHQHTPYLTLQCSKTHFLQQRPLHNKHSHRSPPLQQTCAKHTSIVSRHLATRGNNKLLCTPPPHISSSIEILSA